jgi:hypothetical protein
MTTRRLFHLALLFSLFSVANGSAAAGSGPPAAATTTSSSTSTTSGTTAGAPNSAAASGGGGTAAPSNSGAFFRVGKPTLFVLAYSSDSLSPAYITYEMADYFNARTRRDTQKRPLYWVLPEPGWGISDFMTQCANDPNTLGALILYDTENDTGIFNYVIYEENYTHLYSKVLLVTCDSPFRLRQTQEMQSEMRATTDTVTYSTPTPSPTQGGETAGSSYTESYSAVNPTARKLNGVSDSVKLSSVQLQHAPAPTKTAKPTTPPRHPHKDKLVRIPGKVYTETLTRTVLPTMMIIWQNDKSLDAQGIQGSVPFIGVAAIGGWLATREISRTAMTQTTQTIAPGDSVTTTNTTAGNNSALPYGLALAAPALTSLGSINFGGANGNRVLKTAAARMASLLGRQWHNDCVDPNGNIPEYADSYGDGECSFLFDENRGIFSISDWPDFKVPCYPTSHDPPNEAVFMRGQRLCEP